MTNYYTEEGDLVVGQQALKQQTTSTQTVQGTTNTPAPSTFNQSGSPALTTGSSSAKAQRREEQQPQASGVVVIRQGAEYGNWNQLPPGTGTVIVASDDPNLANTVASLQQAGYTVGIMVTAGSSEDPATYGQRLAHIQNTFHPSILVADTEFITVAGQGVHTDAAWSQTAVDAYKGSATGTTQFAVTFMPSQTGDYPYGVWNGAGSSVQFWPFTFGADPSDPAQVTDANTIYEQTVAGATAAGVNPTQVTVMTAPGQQGVQGQNMLLYAPPPNYGGGNTSGPFSTGAGGGTTPGGVYTGGGDVYTGPHPVALPPVPGETTGKGGVKTGGPPQKAVDWAQAYFGDMGLPQDMVNQIITLAQTHADDQSLFNILAVQYIETTPWFSQHYPGYAAGVQKGMFNSFGEYRDYVNRMNDVFQQYTGRQVGTGDILNALGVGVDANGNLVNVGAAYGPDFLEKQLKGQAFTEANRPDIQYLAGAAGGGQLSPDEMKALGNEKAGIDTALGQRLQQRLQQATERLAGLFQGQTQNPSLALGAQGLNAPSLLGQRGVDQRGSADLSA